MSAVPALSSNSTGQTGAARDAFGELTSEEFVKIMFTELANQDPLKPNDSSQMLEQLSSLRSIQSDIELGNKLADVVTQNQLSTAGAMIGKWVAGLTEQNIRVYGEVESVSRTSDGPVLNLKSGYSIPVRTLDHLLAGDPLSP
ncbi:MAG: flagellar hook capping FlgD N-terminal domain-containing protein, partial [Phycisphaerales bacterium]